MRCTMKNEKGFTLVEVLASLVIISIVLMSFMAIFTNTNRLAVSNSEKLVVINLADAYLERIKMSPGEFITPSPINKTSMSKAIPNHNMNGKEYEVSLKVSPPKDGRNLKLLDIVVTVSLENSNLSSSVEGYISYD